MDKKEKMAANLQKNLPSVKNRPIKIEGAQRFFESLIIVSNNK